MNRDSQENALYMETATGYLKKKDYLFVDPLA